MKSNPWIGLASYNEEILESGHQFVGRSVEIGHLFSLIDNNLFVTLYGKSGIGKSSLLNAGVFPVLRAAQYLPIVCRCNEYDYPASIIQLIQSKCDIHPHEGSRSYSNLVDFFRNNSFTKGEDIVFPVLVFDQFEDWFRINPSAVIKLLRDIIFLISSDYEGVTNYRFVMSIREDYLYMLEDTIDSIGNVELKNNRYRLTELKKNQALEILNLGDVSDLAKQRILQMTKENLGYNPGLLSLYCNELYIKYPNGINDIAVKDIDAGSSLIGSYYQRCFNNSALSSATRKYIEKHLQEDGLRHPQNIETVRQNIPPKELDLLLFGKNRLLRKFPVGNDEHVELMHDKIAEIIFKFHSNEIEMQRKKSVAVTLTLYFIVTTLLFIRIVNQLYGFIYNLIDLNRGLILSYSDNYWAMIRNIPDLRFIGYHIFVVVVFVWMCFVTIPKLICAFFYNKMSLSRTFIVLVLFSIMYFLQSSWFWDWVLINRMIW